MPGISTSAMYHDHHDGVMHAPVAVPMRGLLVVLFVRFSAWMFNSRSMFFTGSQRSGVPGLGHPLTLCWCCQCLACWSPQPRQWQVDAAGKKPAMCKRMIAETARLTGYSPTQHCSITVPRANTSRSSRARLPLRYLDTSHRLHLLIRLLRVISRNCSAHTDLW